MRISTRPLSAWPRGEAPAPGPAPRGVRPEEALGALAGGLALGAPAALLGRELGTRHGMRIVQAALPHALDLISSGWLSPQTALRLAQHALRPAVQAQVGALLLGGIGLAVGTLAGASLASAPD